MASELFVDKITGKTGTSGGAPITLSGDTASVDNTTPFQYYCQLQLQANITVGSSETLVNNWEEPTINSNIGTAVTEDSSDSGIFQFPATGKWWVEFRPTFYLNDDARWIQSFIYKVISGTSTALIRSFTTISRADSDNTYTSDTMGVIFDCTNTTTDKVKFTFKRTGSGTMYCQGTTGNTIETNAFFYRIGNT